MTDTFTPGLVGTIRLDAVVPETNYSIFIDNVGYTYTSEEQTSPIDILTGIANLIPAQFNPVIYKTSIE